MTMTIQIDASQADKINGKPVDQLYVTSYVMKRGYDATDKWIIEIRFCLALRDDAGNYIPTRKERLVVISDVEALATVEAMAGRVDLAMSIPPFQVGLAHAIRSQCPDLNTARYVEVQ